MRNKSICHMFAIKIGSKRYKVIELGKSIHHYHDHTKTARRGKAGDEIHGHVFPNLIRNREWLKQSRR